MGFVAFKNWIMSKSQNVINKFYTHRLKRNVGYLLEKADNLVKKSFSQHI